MSNPEAQHFGSENESKPKPMFSVGDWVVGGADKGRSPEDGNDMRKYIVEVTENYGPAKEFLGYTYTTRWVDDSTLAAGKDPESALERIEKEGTVGTFVKRTYYLNKEKSDE